MVPPPDNTGDEFPDFENMSLEEQMAWLESLAKRQGAGDDELTTSADIDVPMPEDVEVDEPGYVPFEGSRSAREWQQAASAASQVPASESDAGGVENQAQQEPQEPFEEEPAEAFAAESESDDPMQWLDSLAAQPEHELDSDVEAQDEIEAEAEEEAAFLAASDERETKEGAEIAGAESDSEVAEPEAPPDVAVEQEATDSDDPLGGADPMLWLESLAARQGADTSGFTTAADLQLEDAPEDSAVDEPGYVPFEGSRSAREWQQQTSEAQESGETEETEAVEEVAPPAQEQAEDAPQFEPEPVSSQDDGEIEAGEFEAEELDVVGEGDEAMAWLESLAKRQGASEEEFLTAADVDVPELPEDTVVDEPGYVAYDPLSIRPGARDADRVSEASESGADGDEMAEMLEFGNEDADEGLSWLEDLAAEPDEDVTAFLAVEDEDASVPEANMPHEATGQPVRDTQASGAEDVSEGDDPLAGMTDEEITRAQSEGTLTPQQELAWLKRQARALAEAREAEAGAAEYDEVAPAEPGDIPDWLEEIRQTSEEEIVAVADELLDDDEGDELPDWLQGPEEAQAPELESDAGEEPVEVSLDEDVDALWEEVADSEQAAADLDMAIPDSELAAFINNDFVPDEADPLAEALDEEYERRVEGDDAEPEWYTEAVAKVTAEAPPLPESETDAEEGADEETEPVLAAAEPADVPGWLAQEISGDEDELETPADDSEDVEEDMPDWLRDVDAEEASEGEDMPDWLAGEDEVEAGPAPDDVSDWLEREIEATPEPVLPVAAVDVEPEVPVQAPEAPLPDGEQFAEYRAHLEANPHDHARRLALARALRSSQQPDLGLDHYEMLIEAGQLLDEVSADLSAWVTGEAVKPRAHRVLGDAYMRQGKLEQALEAYREALHQL